MSVLYRRTRRTYLYVVAYIRRKQYCEYFVTPVLHVQVERSGQKYYRITVVRAKSESYSTQISTVPVEFPLPQYIFQVFGYY
jgi:hypothetical protein